MIAKIWLTRTVWILIFFLQMEVISKNILDSLKSSRKPLDLCVIFEKIQVYSMIIIHLSVWYARDDTIYFFGLCTIFVFLPSSDVSVPLHVPLKQKLRTFELKLAFSWNTLVYSTVGGVETMEVFGFIKKMLYKRDIMKACDQVTTTFSALSFLA